MSYPRLTLILCLSLVVAALASFLCGPVVSRPSDLLAWLGGNGDAHLNIIFADIRAPRIVLAAITGFVLGLAGAATQGLLRNPLAEPSLLGASNAAALGAVIAIYLGLSGTLSYAVPLSAALAALLSVLLLLVFAGRGVSSVRLILAGFAVSALAGAGIALALNFSANIFAALEISFWLLGAVENRSWHHVALVLPGSLIGVGLLLSGGRALNALALGDDVAASLGVRLNRLRWRFALGIALAMGAVVSVTGVIGFIGLVAPHLVRPLVGHNPHQSLIPSALMGAILLLVADSLVRLLPSQQELKLGVLTAFLGVPMLLYLLRRTTTADAVA
jgi:iron complex transport system permease protein